MNYWLFFTGFKRFSIPTGNALNAASLSLDSWKAITDADVLRELKVQRPLLQVIFTRGVDSNYLAHLINVQYNSGIRNLYKMRFV